GRGDVISGPSWRADRDACAPSKVQRRKENAPDSASEARRIRLVRIQALVARITVDRVRIVRVRIVRPVSAVSPVTVIAVVESNVHHETARIDPAGEADRSSAIGIAALGRGTAHAIPAVTANLDARDAEHPAAAAISITVAAIAAEP